MGFISQLLTAGAPPWLHLSAEHRHLATLLSTCTKGFSLLAMDGGRMEIKTDRPHQTD